MNKIAFKCNIVLIILRTFDCNFFFSFSGNLIHKLFVIFTSYFKFLICFLGYWEEGGLYRLFSIYALIAKNDNIVVVSRISEFPIIALI